MDDPNRNQGPFLDPKPGGGLLRRLFGRSGGGSIQGPPPPSSYAPRPHAAPKPIPTSGRRRFSLSCRRSKVSALVTKVLSAEPPEAPAPAAPEPATESGTF